MTPDDIAALRQALSACVNAPDATPGLWAICPVDMSRIGFDATDADFIAAASPDRITRLLDALEAAQKWQPIETAPKDGRGMFVVCGFNVTNENCGARNYTTDPYCVWPGDGGGFVRWPHPFPPTHWMPLPAAPVAAMKDHP